MRRTTRTLALLGACALLGAPALPGHAQSAAYTASLNLARSNEMQRRTGVALQYYRDALKQAQTDPERAEAQLGIAGNVAIRYGKPDPKTDGTLKIGEYRKVLELPQAPAAARVRAHQGIADTQAALGQFEAAVATLKQVLDMADASAAEKISAELSTGSHLVSAKRYDDARARFSAVIKKPEAEPVQRLAAYQGTARSYLAQSNLAAAQKEIAAINGLTGFTDEQRAEIHLLNGTLLVEAGHYAPARAEYARIAILADASPEKSFLARYRTAEAFFKEGSFASARESWTQALSMRGSEKFTADIWHAIGLSHRGEKNYAAAREAYMKWLAVPGLDLRTTVQVWQAVAESYVQEKNYAGAREALANISKGHPLTQPLGSSLYLRQMLDVADTYRLEGKPEEAARTYTAMLDHMQGFPGAASGNKPLDHYQVADRIWELAEAMAKEKPTMAAAFTVYEALEKYFPYELQDARAFLGMGDILLAQGKRAEAREKYQKALDLRATYDEGKIAREKIRQLDEQKQ